MSRTERDGHPAGDEKTPGEVFTRGGETLSLVEEFAAETLGALAIDPRWFELSDHWEADGNTITAAVRLYREDGSLGPQRYRVTLTVEPDDQPDHEHDSKA